MESLLSDAVGGLKYELLMDFLRHRVSVTRKQKVEDTLVEYIARLEAEWNSSETAIAAATSVKEEKPDETKSEPRQSPEAALPHARVRPRRAGSVRYYNEEALAGEELSDRLPDERKEKERDRDVLPEDVEMHAADEAYDDEDVVDEAEHASEAELAPATKKKRGPSSGAGHVYSLSHKPRWPTRHPFQSPFSRPSWSIKPFSTQPFDDAFFIDSAQPALSFIASGKPVTLPPFTAITSSSSDRFHRTVSIVACWWGDRCDGLGSCRLAFSLPVVCHSLPARRTVQHQVSLVYTAHWNWHAVFCGVSKQQSDAAMALAIEHDRGGVMDMRWYPQGVWQKEGSGEAQGRLGLLAVGFTDGSVVVLAVPHPRPNEAGMRLAQLSSLPHVVLVPPPLDCRLSLPVPLPTSLAFSCHASPAYLAIGQSHSAVVVYTLSSLDPASSSTSPVPSFHLTPRLGHQAVRALTFSPANPHQLLMATMQGEILLLDLRCPFHPIATIPAYTSDPITTLHYFTSRPSVILTSSRNRPRLHFLLHEAGDIRSLPLRGLSSVRSGPQRQDLGTCWCVDVLEDEECGATIAVCGWSDGRVDLIGWRTADSELDKSQCRVRRLCWLGWTRPDDDGQRQLLLGEGGPCKQLTGRGKVDVAELNDEQRVELTAVEAALDEHVAVHHVAANPNVVFPRQFAVGGLASVVRIQQVSDM